MPKALKSCPMSKKSPNLVTLFSSAHKMTDIAVVSHGFNVFSVCSYTTTIIMFFNVLVSAVASMKFLNTITLVKAQVAIISCTWPQQCILFPMFMIYFKKYLFTKKFRNIFLCLRYVGSRIDALCVYVCIVLFEFGWIQMYLWALRCELVNVCLGCMGMR